MQLKKLKVGMHVNTTAGHGVVMRVGGTHPLSVKVNIVGPLPRGPTHVRPADVLHEIEPDEIARQRKPLAVPDPIPHPVNLAPPPPLDRALGVEINRLGVQLAHKRRLAWKRVLAKALLLAAAWDNFNRAIDGRGNEDAAELKMAQAEKALEQAAREWSKL